MKWVDVNPFLGGCDAHPSSLMDSIASPKVKTIKEGVGACSLVCSTSGIEGHVGNLGSGLRKLTRNSITHTNLHKPNNKLVSAQSEHFWCKNEPWANIDSQDSLWPELGGSHNLSPYSILYAQPRDQYPNVILSRNSKVGVPKFPKLGLLQLWGPITRCANV